MVAGPKKGVWERGKGRGMSIKIKCVACGMCIHRCPNKNIEMVQTGTDNLVT